MSSGDTRLIFVSGIDLGYTSALHHELKSALPARFPERTFVFVGNPFKGWQHPSLLRRSRRIVDPRIRLLRCWIPFAQHLLKMGPAFEKGYTVVGLRGGYDAAAYATSRIPEDARDEDEKKKIARLNKLAFDLHHEGLVKAVVKQEMQHLPQYVLTCADPQTITRDWIKRSPALKGRVSHKRLCDFVRHENGTKEMYFDPEYGQRTPIRVPVTSSMQDMVETALAGLETVLRPEALQRAAVA